MVRYVGITAGLRFLLSCLIGLSGFLPGAGESLAAAPLASLALIQTISEGAYGGEAVWGDIDNDGDMDVVMSGRSNAGTQTFYLRNDGGSLSYVSTTMPGTELGAVVLGDFDRDSDIDVFITGQTGLSGGHVVGVAEIYANDGSGSFTLFHSLPDLYRSAGDWGDYDNDGDLDLLVCGYRSGGIGYGAIYRNDGGILLEQTGINVPDVGDCSVQFGDYNADEDLDFVIMGKTTAGGTTILTQVINNNGSGSFSGAINLGGLWNGSASWADFDNDDDLDLLVSGNLGTSSYVPATRLYRNNGSLSFEQLTTPLPSAWQSSTSWGDYDNDGDLDLLFNGLTAAGNLTRVYINTGGGSFTDAQANLSSGTAAAVAWGHLDGDRSLDILVTGVEDADTTISTFVYQNIPAAVNSPPSHPGLVRGCWDGSSRVFLDWNNASDAQTRSDGLTYNLRVGTAPGLADVVNPAAGADGLRRLAESGNVQSRSETFLRLLPVGDYYWSVQAVDTAQVGGAFSSEGFFNVGVRIAQDDSDYFTAEAVPVDIPVLSNDLSGYGDLSIATVENPPHGSAVVSGSVIRYTPDSGYTGPDSFGYYAETSQGYCARGFISLTVTGIQLSNSVILEEQPVGSRVGLFSTSDPDPTETFTYSLVDGTGSADNPSFTVHGNELLTAGVFDYETQSIYSVRVRAAGSLGSVYEKAFTIQVISDGEIAPTGILLSNDSVYSGLPAGALVGFLSTVGDASHTFTYTLDPDSACPNNDSFSIEGDRLVTAVTFGLAAGTQQAVCIRSTDDHSGDSIVENFVIAIRSRTLLPLILDQ